MRKLLRLLSYVSLVGVMLPPCLYLAGKMPLESVKHWMLLGTIAWFVTVPFWMDRKSEP